MDKPDTPSPDKPARAAASPVSPPSDASPTAASAPSDAPQHAGAPTAAPQHASPTAAPAPSAAPQHVSPTAAPAQPSPRPSLRQGALALCLLGIVACLLYLYAIPQQDSDAPETQPTITLPEGGVRSDAFSLRLLQAAARQSSGNAVVSPAMVTEMILALREIDGRPIDESCRHFGLSATQISPSTLPLYAMQLFADEQQELTAEHRDIVSVPLARQYRSCLSLINRLSAADPGKNSLVLIDSDLSPQMQILAVADLSWEPRWLTPISKDLRQNLPFYGRGAQPEVPTMCTTARYRCAEAADGSWTAVTLFLRRDEKEGDSLGYTIVMPKGNVRDFVGHMTLEQLNAIRAALLEAPERPVCLQIPVLHISSGGVQDMLPLLRSMNIDPMPRSRAGENEGQAMRGALYLRFNLRLAESTDEEIENTGGASRAGNDGPTLTFSRPFVWWISDAASDAPFLFAGITEAP